jgi:acetyl esterase/lipase
MQSFSPKLGFNPTSMHPKRLLIVAGALSLVSLLPCPRILAADMPADAAVAAAPLPPLPSPVIPSAGAKTDAAYAPLPLAPGGVVIPLFPPDSPYLNKAKVTEPEKYNFYEPPNKGLYLTGIHNPSLEFHAGDAALNTGATIILAAGGAHMRLGVQSEGIDAVYYFANFGINTVILRNRLRSDGYDPKTDGVYDALQAIKITRAYAKQWKLDPNKIGIMGFSAGAELAAATTLQWADFDKKNDVPSNPFAKISSRPDFAALIYPGPSLFTRGGTPVIPRDIPPSFIACAGWGDAIHALWATEYFNAMLADGVPNVELHIFARGHHPGDKVGAGEPPSGGGLNDRGFIAYGKWGERYLDWFKDLGFMQAPGVETQAAKDVAANLNRLKLSERWHPPHAAGAAAAPAADTTKKAP